MEIIGCCLVPIYFSFITRSTAGRSAGAHFNEFKFSRLSQINLECSLAVGEPSIILHLMEMRLIVKESYSWI